MQTARLCSLTIPGRVTSFDPGRACLGGGGTVVVVLTSILGSAEPVTAAPVTVVILEEHRV